MFLLVILILLIAAVARVTAPLRWHRRGRLYPGNPYTWNPYRYGCRRHHRLLGRILPIVALVALDRIFTRRYW